jgi:hypothetical protein
MRRYLRIAFSGSCAVLGALIVLLWVRSYWWVDAVALGPGRYLGSMRGEFCVDCHYTYPPMIMPTTRHIESLGIVSIRNADRVVIESVHKFEVPMWAAVLLVAGAAATPWIAWRISWSTAWGLTAIGVLATWIAMYNDAWGHYQAITRSTVVSIEGNRGQTALAIWDLTRGGPGPNSVLWTRRNDPSGQRATLGFRFLGPRATGGGVVAVTPYWFWMLVAVALGAAPWLPWSKRFSLRTMLVVMTIVAVLLGAVVVVARWG